MKRRNLRDQIRCMLERHSNKEFADSLAFPEVLNALCRQAFVEEWHLNHLDDSRILLYAAKLFARDGGIDGDVPWYLP